MPPDPVPGPDPARGVWRLRDLSRAGRVVAAVVVVLLMVPVLSSLVRAHDVGWLPSGDDALIVLRSFDVLSSDAPLVGQPSTAEEYAPGVAARHPGPAEFYLLALPVRLLGPDLGTLLTAAALAGGSVLLTAWAVFRRAGPSVGLGAAVVLGFVMWSSGTAVLSDPISSNVGGYPLIAGTALAWAAWCGDHRLWPWAVAVWSFTIQQHLAIFGVAGLVAAWGVTGAIVASWRRRDDLAQTRERIRWAILSGAIAVACWLPPLLDQVAGTGNLRKILSFSSSDERDHIGLAAGVRAAGRAVAFPPILLTRQLSDVNPDDRHLPGGGLHLIAPFDAVGGFNAVLGAALLVATGVVAWRSWRRGGDGGPRLALVATAVVVLVGGIVTTSQIPDSVEQARINFYRWVWPASAAAWGAISWTACRWIARVLALPALSGAGEATDDAPAGDVEDPAPDPVGDLGRGVGLRPVAVGLALATLAVAVGATALVQGEGDERRDEVLFAFDRAAGDALVEALPADRPVRLVTDGFAAYLSVAPALGVALHDAGHDVRVDPSFGAFWDHRARPPEEGEIVVCVLSGPVEVPDGPGTTVASEQLPNERGGREEVWGDAAYAVRVLPEGETRCRA